jgi:glycosyltransferase involved in cell wall biosynthesis
MPHTSLDIALFIRSLYGGGAEKMKLNLARSFLEQGLKVDIVLAKKEGSLLKSVPSGVRLVDLEAKSKLDILPKLIGYLKREKPLNLVASLHYPCEIALLAKRLAGVSTKVTVSEHNHLSIESQCTNQISVRLTPLAARLFYPWADSIMAVSQGVADDLANVTKISRERIQVIYNPVITTEILSKAKEPVEHPWFALGQPPVILGVGRLYPQKDFPTLIRAFGEVRKIRPARLVILGSGPEQENLEKLIQELGLEKDVALLGFVNNPYAYMARAGVFVLSSIFEGLGNVLIEALAVGTPVISTDCKSGPSEILANGKYGFLTPVGDSQKMAEAILSVLSGNTKQVDSNWLQQFTLEICTAKYLNMLGIKTR